MRERSEEKGDEELKGEGKVGSKWEIGDEELVEDVRESEEARRVRKL